MLASIPQHFLNTAVTSIRRIPLGTSYQVRIESSRGMALYDHVVLATHSDQSLKLLDDISDEEHAVLAAVSYQPNQAILHTDASCLPQSRKAWSAWNYESAGPGEANVCVHYLLNKLQPLPCKTPVIVSLNPIHAPDPSKVLASFDYAHPVFDGPAIEAQRTLRSLQGKRNTWFAGAWTGYGFHEDGLKSGLSVAAAIAALPEAAVKQAA
jgi:predicted NAD/FAD-binding protein